MGATLESTGTSVPPLVPGLRLFLFSAAMQQISGIQNTRPVRKLTIEGTIDI
jgi:hypothetical protein